MTHGLFRGKLCDTENYSRKTGGFIVEGISSVENKNRGGNAPRLNRYNVGTPENVKYENVMYYLSNAADCALEDPDGAAYIEIPFILSGDPDEFTESVTIGTVTITLTSAAGCSNITEYLTSQGYA